MATLGVQTPHKIDLRRFAYEKDGEENARKYIAFQKSLYHQQLTEK